MADKILTADELISILKKQGNRYRYTQIHHTYRPNHAAFNGKNHMQLQQGMRNYHVNVRGWNDIGQHVTLMPDGLFVTGRDFDDDKIDFDEVPAGIAGYNSGAFMTEILGDFDAGKDRLVGAQLEAMLKLQHYLVNEAGAKIVFHREAALKTCPGTGIDKGWFTQAVASYKSNEPVKVVKPVTQVKSAVVVNFLNKGDKGDSVIALQKRLISLGYKLPKYGADGHFGTETDVALRSFQEDNNLNPDGIVGPLTAAKLGSARKNKYPGILFELKRPYMSGEYVKKIQRRAGMTGNDVDGWYGPDTVKAVKKFQKQHGLKQDGKTGPATWAKLF